MPHLGEKADRTASGGSRAVTLSGSPATFTTDAFGVLLLSGGTVSLVEYLRAGVAVTVGVLAGAITVARGDSIRITYLVAPTATFIPIGT